MLNGRSPGKSLTNAKTLLNGEQQKPKNMWVPAEYKTTLDNLEKMRLEKSHLANLIRERRESKWVYVNVKNHEATRAYLDLQNDLKRQINGLLANAAQMEAVNPTASIAALPQNISTLRTTEGRQRCLNSRQDYSRITIQQLQSLS